MNDQRSNVNLLSNIYPVKVLDGKIEFKSDIEFVGRIMDRSALKKLVFMVCGHMAYHEQIVEYLKTINGIQDLQIRRMEGCDECALAERGEKPYGFMIESGQYREICKCIKMNCSKFKECRPDMESDNV